MEDIHWGQRLKQRRQHLGLTQAQLAELGGVFQQRISRLERRGGSTRDLVPLAAALGVSAEWLLLGQTIATLAEQDQVNDGPDTYRLSRRELDLLAEFSGLTDSQQRQALAEVSRLRNQNDELISELLGRWGSLAAATASATREKSTGAEHD